MAEESAFEVIDNNEQLTSAVAHLSKCDALALDLEFDRNRMRYGFNLCLIQVFGNDRCFIIDPLAKIDLQPFYRLLENPAIEKVVFAFREDLNLLKLQGCQVKNIYDINHAVKLLNFSKTSLSAVLDEVLSIETSKEAQKSNWFKRPLSSAQLSYAADDVLYLFQLKEQVHQLAINKGIDGWIQEENEVYDSMEFEEELEYDKHKHKSGLNQIEWHIYRALLMLRESEAERLNRPAYQVLNKDVFRDIARDPKLIKQWGSFKGIHPRLQSTQFQTRLKELVEQSLDEAKQLGLDSEKSAHPRLPRAEWLAQKAEKAKLQSIHQTVFKPIQDELARRYGEFAGPIILGNKTVEEIVAGNLSQVREYKQTVVKKCAQDLGISVAPYLD